jgi:hypothetical protein
MCEDWKARALKAEAEAKRLREGLGTLYSWSEVRLGRVLCPPGPDTYGEGVRETKKAAQQMIVAILKGER